MTYPGGRKSEPIAKRLARILRSLAFLFGASGIVVLGLQAIAWFRTGMWAETSFLDLWLAFGNSYSLKASSRSERWLLQLYTLPAWPTLIALALIVLLVARRVEGR